MSMVGPRPTLAYQVEQYSAEQLGRLLVKPGLTGWAQIHGRNGISWGERIKLDIWYVRHMSLGLDLHIIFKTPLQMVRVKEIYGKPEKFVIKDWS